ncbi:MAG: hypothetical protein HY547_03495 [Elusimicrobia bacterium]|nr:hypothetical protein [Elusimicrobiota bacterium]
MQENENALKPEYHPGKEIKLTSTQAFEIAVGAILTQNTAWSNVEKALIEINRRGLMSPHKMIATRNSRLAMVIRSSGYFAQKAKKLKILARFAIREARGHLLRLKKEPLLALRDQLLSLWGVGPETADSILLYALGKPVFVIDAYTRRIGERLGWRQASQHYERYRNFFETALILNAGLFQEYHALFVELAKRHCTKQNPICATCPLEQRCPYGLKMRSR